MYEEDCNVQLPIVLKFIFSASYAKVHIIQSKYKIINDTQQLKQHLVCSMEAGHDLEGALCRA